jgi:phosphoglycerol transferase MdoB-like AlkP superfamily enzyme
MSESRTIQVGPGLPVLLFITFLVLKLTEVIDWSWWWVTAPLWAPLAFILVVVVLWIAIVMPIALIASTPRGRRSRIRVYRSRLGRSQGPSHYR